MEREEFGAAPSTGVPSETNQLRRTRAEATAAKARAGEEPALPFWLVTLLFLGLPVTLAGILLVTWMALFG